MSLDRRAVRRLTSALCGVAIACVAQPAQAYYALPDPITPSTSETASEGLLSKDGGLIAYSSYAGDLVPNDTNRASDVFVTNVKTRQTRRVSVFPDGTQSPGGAYLEAFSNDGRYVVFSEQGAALLPGAGLYDQYRLDLQTGTLIYLHGAYMRVTAISEDGNTMAGVSGCPVIYNVATGASTNLYCNYSVGKVKLSADGSTAVWEAASDSYTVPGSWRPDVLVSIFAYRISSATSSVVSSDNCGRSLTGSSTDPSVSADGSSVTFSHDGTLSMAPLLCGELVRGGSQVYLKDLRTGKTELISAGTGITPGDTHSSSGRVSGDGRYVVFYSRSLTVDPANYGSYGSHYYVRDRVLLTTTRVDAMSYADQFEGAIYVNISSDGSLISLTLLGLYWQLSGQQHGWSLFVVSNPSPASLVGIVG